MMQNDSLIKNNMKFKGLFILIFIFTTVVLKAQKDFKPGYIITQKGDTVYGEIDYRGDLLMGEVCTFKPNGQNSEEKFSPNDIRAFRFTNSKYYVSQEFGSQKVFMEFLIKGRVSIYYLRDQNGDHYFLQKEGDKMVEIPYSEKMIHKDGMDYLWQSTNHIGLLKIYMDDAPDFQSEIEKIKKPGTENLIKLTEDYQNKVCKGEKCIIYEKKVSFIKLNLELAGGFVNYQNLDNLKDINYFQMGIITHIWMPRLNEKIYFRTGILFSTLNLNNSKFSVYKIPLQLEYIYPKSIIRPKIALGMNFYDPAYQTVSLMTGANLKLNKSFYWSFEGDFDFMPSNKFMLVPKKLFSESFLTI